MVDTVFQGWSDQCARNIASAVLHQAVLDLSIPREKENAIAFLESADSEFFADILDIDPDVFKKAIKKKIDNKSGGECRQMNFGIDF